MIFSAFERMVALRYLRARRKEGFVSVIAGFSLAGIALGVATLIIVMAVMNGFRAELLGRILGLNGHLGVYATSGPLRDFDALAGRIRAMEGIRRVTPVVAGQAMATANGTAHGAVVRGVRYADIKTMKVIARNIQLGSLDDFRRRDDIVIGTRFARRLGVGPGGRVTLISPRSMATAFGSLPRVKTFRVAATFEIGMYEYDSSFVFMPLETAQILYRTGRDGVTSLEVMLPDADQVPRFRRLITEAARATVRLVDWQRANASFFNAIQVERNVMFLILTLIIVVAAFNVISGMIMMVNDKGRDIAILRTMGATRGMVMRIFFLAGASVGVIGTLLGFVAGLALAANIETIRQWLEGLTGTELFAAEIYFLSKLPAKVEATETAAVVLMALALSFLATLYPAWRAARLDPVEALRYE
jgi:lipoprotein-releasing system permease protein